MEYTVESFQINLNGVPYLVETREYDYNGQKRYLVSYNGGEENVFVFDPKVNQYVSIGKNTSTIPDTLEKAISDRLITFPKKES